MPRRFSGGLFLGRREFHALAASSTIWSPFFTPTATKKAGTPRALPKCYGNISGASGRKFCACSSASILGAGGSCATTSRRRTGRAVASPCSAMRPIRCSNNSRKAPAWRPKTRWCWRRKWPRPRTICRRLSRLTRKTVTCVPRRTQIMARIYGDFYHARGVTAELRNLALGGRTPE
jgi:hypothetical protein